MASLTKIIISKKTVLLLISLLTMMSVYSQNGIVNAPNTVFVKNNNSEDFLISTIPVTNREYILYLHWLLVVYGSDFPEVFFNAFPGIDTSVINKKAFDHWKPDSLTSSYFDCSDFGMDRTYYYQFCIENSPTFIKDYIYNPKYIDYPVIGLNWLQAGRYCKWLTDRYNENTLFKRGIFKPMWSDYNENHFVTESYLIDLYDGYLKKQIRVNWSDSIFIPTFRLPTKSELSLCIANRICEQDIKPYKLEKKYFLSLWLNRFMKVDNQYIYLNSQPGEYKGCSISLPLKQWDNKIHQFDELVLDQNLTNNYLDILEIFKQNGQNIMDYHFPVWDKNTSRYIKNPNYKYFNNLKDSLGMCPFMIIDENENKEPVLVENYSKSNSIIIDKNKYYIFRIACTMKPKQYMPISH